MNKIKDSISKNRPHSIKTSRGRQKKEQIVAELSQRTSKSKALFFADYEGMTHKQIEEIKKSLKKADAQWVVAKNTLLKLSLEKSQPEKAEKKELEGLASMLSGQTAAVFAYADAITPLKEITKALKALRMAISPDGKIGPTLKFGIFEGKLLAEAELARLSTLPSREVLIAQLLYNMKSPISGLVFTLNANIQKFVMTLKAIEKNKTSI